MTIFKEKIKPIYVWDSDDCSASLRLKINTGIKFVDKSSIAIVLQTDGEYYFCVKLAGHPINDGRCKSMSEAKTACENVILEICGNLLGLNNSDGEQS